MKYFYLVILVIALGSCSPENMLNKKLNGEWTLISINDKNLDSNYSKTARFSKDGVGGDVLYTINDNGNIITQTGKYALIKSQSISTAFKNDQFGSGYETEVFDFTKSTDTDLTLTQQGNINNVFIYKKK